MTGADGISGDTRKALASRLAGVRESFLTVIHTLEGLALTEGPASTVQHQLKWASAHVQAAVLALCSKDGAAAIEQPPVLPRPRTAGGSKGADPIAAVDSLDFSQGLRGHTQSISIAEILGFIASLRKSGTLVVHAAEEDFLIELLDGNVIYAQGDHPPPGLLLGEILVAQGAVLQEELDEFLEEEPTDEQILGTALLEDGVITREALRIALSYQVQHLFFRMTREQDAYFQFEEDIHRINSDDILLNVQMLLLESARTQDEQDADQVA